ncbi:MAG: hypothetical protein GY754_03350 [bacterium]|nr:hypothetical protein [bacterium]
MNRCQIYKTERKQQKERKQTTVPQELREYIILYATAHPDTFLVECLTNQDLRDIEAEKDLYTEEEYEEDINYKKTDVTARIEKKTQLIKVRKLDRTICDGLKELYEHKCQVCGANHGARYDTRIAEAHHIESFTKTLNNNPENIMILCPNHHRVMHKTNPRFDRKNLLMIYPNGLKEKVEERKKHLTIK